MLNDSYGTFSRLLYVYVRKAALNEKGNHAKEFMQWFLQDAQKRAMFHGFVPLLERNYSEGLSKINP